MKKLLTILLIFIVALSGIYAETSYRFIFADMDQHSEILIGFCPTYLLLGVGMDFHLVENNTSELQILLGGGYNQRRVFQDPNTGDPYEPGKYITYDAIQGDLFLRYDQGFLDDLLIF